MLSISLTAPWQSFDEPDCPLSIIQQKYCVESIFHLTCRDRNTIGLQAELLGAYALGVHNISL